MKHSRIHYPPVWRVIGAPSPSRKVLVLTLAIFINILSAEACHAVADASRFTGERARTLPELVAGLVRRSADLTYISEQDSEVFVFYRNTQVKEITDSVLLSLLRRPSESRVHQESWSTFFQLRTSTDPTGRWTLLRQYLEANLTNLAVFRLPRDDPYGAQYDLYAVGLFDGNIVVGVQMFGVAT